MINEGPFHLSFVDFSINGASFVTVLGILDCAVSCRNTKNCQSFFYNRNMQSCALSLARYQGTSELTPQAGIKYYSMSNGFGKPCGYSSECNYQSSACRQGSCQCDVGFSYKPSRSCCVKRCREYGDVFSTYEGQAVKGCKMKVISAKWHEMCLMECQTSRSFVCATAEFSAKYACYDVRCNKRGKM